MKQIIKLITPSNAKKLLNLMPTNNTTVNDTSHEKNGDGEFIGFKEVTDFIPSPDALDFFNKLQGAYETYKETEIEIKKIEAQRDILITEITERYNFYHTTFDRIFEERSVAINKSFEIIDEGLKKDDKDLINIGMQGLSKVVSSSPFGDVDKLSEMIRDNEKIEI